MLHQQLGVLARISNSTPPTIGGQVKWRIPTVLAARSLPRTGGVSLQPRQTLFHFEQPLLQRLDRLGLRQILHGARARGEEQAQEEPAARGHAPLHDLRDGRRGHAGQVSSFGAQTFFWIAILSVFFLLPYAFVMSELGSSFVQEGGPYEWMKLCYGRLTAGFGAVLYWITNPLWVGGTLCFLASGAFSEYFIHLGGPKISFLGDTPFFDLLFKVAFIWISIIVAIAALDHGKWIPNFGAVCRAFVLLFFSFTVLITVKHGIDGFGFKDFIPGATSVSAVIFLESCRCCSSTTWASSSRTGRPRRWSIRKRTCRSRSSAARSRP